MIRTRVFLSVVSAHFSSSTFHTMLRRMRLKPCSTRRNTPRFTSHLQATRVSPVASLIICAGFNILSHKLCIFRLIFVKKSYDMRLASALLSTITYVSAFTSAIDARNADDYCRMYVSVTFPTILAPFLPASQRALLAFL